MLASYKGHLDVVRTLLESGAADVNAKDNVRNQMMMMIMIIKLLTIKILKLMIM